GDHNLKDLAGHRSIYAPLAGFSGRFETHPVKQRVLFIADIHRTPASVGRKADRMMIVLYIINFIEFCSHPQQKTSVVLAAELIGMRLMLETDFAGIFLKFKLDRLIINTGFELHILMGLDFGKTFAGCPKGKILEMVGIIKNGCGNFAAVALVGFHKAKAEQVDKIIAQFAIELSRFVHNALEAFGENKFFQNLSLRFSDFSLAHDRYFS